MNKIESKLGSSGQDAPQIQGRKMLTIENEREKLIDEQNVYKPDPKLDYIRQRQQILNQQKQSDDETKLSYLKQRQQAIEHQKTQDISFAKERIEFLAGIARATDDLEVDGIKFSLQTLKNRELRQIANITRNFGSTESQVSAFDVAFELRLTILAYSLYKIDNVPVEDVIGPTFEERVRFLEEMDDNLIVLLYKKYNNLVSDTRKKYGISSEEELKEVTDSVKKS